MKTNFLQFDAQQIKQSIYEALKADGRYSDYLYPESKLSAYVDAIAASHETLMFYLNNQTADSVFNSTQTESNMLGIVKLIDYHAKGMRPSTVNVTILPSSGANTTLTYAGTPFSFTIPKEAYFYDEARGRYWSPVADFTVGEIVMSTGITSQFVCGRWIDSGNVWTTNGTPFQTIQLSKIDSTNVGWPFVEVYVNGQKWNLVYDKSLERQINIDPDTMNIVELGIDEDVKYTLRFGDGTTGTKPANGSKITIKYLLSNDGANGVINAHKITLFAPNGGQDKFKSTVISSNTSLNDKWTTVASSLYSDNLDLRTSNGETTEDVDSIRSAAPQSIYSNDKLVRSNDYRNFILANYPALVKDIAVQNNFEFASSFYSWLDKYSLLDWNVRKYGYANLGANDSGNVYLWMIGTTTNADFSQITNSIAPIVANGQNPVVMAGVDQNVQFGFYVPEFSTMTIANIITMLSSGNNFKIVIKRSSTNGDISTIRTNVIATILSYMRTASGNFGASVDASKLTNNIKQIPYVESVSMRYANGSTTAISPVLSFSTWNTSYVGGADLRIDSGTNYSNSLVVAEPFMYFNFINTLLTGNMIIVE